MITGKFFTVTEMAEQLSVSRQRVHQLIKAYGVKIQKAGRTVLVSQKEFKKIPVDRESGVHVSR